MQKDLLAELHLPELDLKSLKNIVTQNSARLANLINESKEYLNDTKTVPTGLKEVGSMVSDFTAIDYPTSTPKENIKSPKQECIVKKTLFPNDTTSKNNIYPTTGSSTDECNPTKDCIINDKDEPVEILESSKNLPNAETFSSPVDALSVTEKNLHPESQHLKDDVGTRLSGQKIQIQVPIKKSSPTSSTVSPGVSILKRNSICSLSEKAAPATVEDVTKQSETSHLEKSPESAVCIISEVIGNAACAFSPVDDTYENSSAQTDPEIQLITPKKTDDITKIKGWRRKQFFVEKPTTIEFYSIAKGSLALKKKVNLKEGNSIQEASPDPGNVENAFVCDSLDDFLDREAELKIGYEVPHLYAEFGIKLTRDEIVSKPNLSEKDIKEMETRYFMPVSLPSDIIDLALIKEENIKGLKRPIDDDPKQCKIIKLDDDKRQPVKAAQYSEDKLKVEGSVSECQTSSNVKSNNKNVKITRKSATDFTRVKLVSKLIALVVYPGPSAPLHPLVQYHLDKIRSYRTRVDSDWANFAVSAVLVKDKKYKRKILPAYCCAKIETNSVVNTSNIETNEVSVQEQVDCVSVTPKPKDRANKKNDEKKPIKIKDCSVVLEKFSPVKALAPWCMVHNRYNCVQCGLGRPKSKKPKINKTVLDKTPIQNEDVGETVIVSPRASFDKRIASLLAKKVRLLKVNGDILKSIDCLKTLTVDTVEFIKLKFVKESFLSGYLNIWYVKPDDSGVKFRAFLTFSHTPPLPNAINLKSSAFSLKNLPKVITEIVSTENTFDSNEYAILHCDGKIWEIHGSLNIAFGKFDKNVEQIFASAELPELKVLQEIAHNILHVKAVKWWVLDLTQKFRLMEVNFSNENVILTRKKFIEAIEKNFFGFLPFRKGSGGRNLGAFIMQRLLPFILIGPYYLLEANDLTLKGDSSTVPFLYFGEENVTQDYPLKFFINSVIKNMEKCEKKLVGLWLYDKMCLDFTSYLEVVTANVMVPLLNKYTSIQIEHGYSLNSLTNPILPLGNPGIIKRKDGKEEFKKIPVYLYFDIIELGFVAGELQLDNSVIISHPLDRRTKMKSHKIGDWFIGIIKRKIEFIPKNLVVKWFITKHREDLRERRPFNKFFLGGAHILTQNGVFYLLEMSDFKIKTLGIDKNEIIKAISQSEVIKEVQELKSLSNLLVNDPTVTLSMQEILVEAISEIKKLRLIQIALKNEKKTAENEKTMLCIRLIRKLNNCRVPFHLKIKIIEKLEPLFRNRNGVLDQSFPKILKTSRIGRKYLERIERNRIRALDRKMFAPIQPKKDKIISDQIEAAVPPVALTPIKVEVHECVPNPDTPIQAIVNTPINIASTNVPPQYSELHVEIEKLDSVPKNATPIKNSYPNEALTISTPENDTGKEITKNAQLPDENNQPSKKGEFLKISSPNLPENIKLSWKNWSVKKLEVV